MAALCAYMNMIRRCESAGTQRVIVKHELFVGSNIYIYCQLYLLFFKLKQHGASKAICYVGFRVHIFWSWRSSVDLHLSQVAAEQSSVRGGIALQRVRFKQNHIFNQKALTFYPFTTRLTQAFYTICVLTGHTVENVICASVA